MKKKDKLYRSALKTTDLAEAATLLTQAHEAGSHDAAYLLGSWHLTGKHIASGDKAAVQYLQFALEGDVPEAYFDLAICYESGKGVKKDKRKAFLHYMEAALLGHPRALYAVGRCYYHGVGVEKDEDLAKIWLSRSNDSLEMD